ncbi:MAG: KH domain-containing protein [Defluviitaleaceae bacterium]|nr:KH domain-containing protein [Defluviitaleaceae bacterium]
MKELLILVAKNLVDQPEHVNVIEEENDGITTLRLKVAPDDMGKVIGKQGRIARAIRTLVKAAAINEEKKVNVEII